MNEMIQRYEMDSDYPAIEDPNGEWVKYEDIAASQPPSGHPDDDFVATAQRYRTEHEATHGEAEQCGGPCIVLGLADFDDPGASQPPSGDAPEPGSLAYASRVLADTWKQSGRILSGDAPYLREALERMRRAYERGADASDLVRLIDTALATPTVPAPTYEQGYIDAATEARNRRLATPIDWYRLAWAMETVADEDERLGVVGRGRKIDRIAAAYAAIVEPVE